MVAVLSARGKHTDELVAMAYEVSDQPDPREMDMLLSTGERVSCALAAMVINDLGHEAISLTGSQAGIVTDSGHTKARIIEVKADRIRRGARRRQDRARGGLPGRLAGVARRDDARPRRLRHDRGRARRRAGRRRLRDLHRRRRRVQRRSAHRARRPQAAGGHVRGDARDVGVAARACSSSAPSSTRATTASRSTADQASRTDPVPWSRTRNRPWNDRSSQPSPTRPREARITITGLPDEPGHRRPRAHRARRRQHERGHDHPERAAVARAIWRTCRSRSRATTWPRRARRSSR